MATTPLGEGPILGPEVPPASLPGGIGREELLPGRSVKRLSSALETQAQMISRISEQPLEKVKQDVVPAMRPLEEPSTLVQMGSVASGMLPPDVRERKEAVEIRLEPGNRAPGMPQGAFSIYERMKALGVSAANVAVINHGIVEWSDRYGDAKPGMLFQAASITKSVTALTVLSLVQEGLLRLNTNVKDVLSKELWERLDPDHVSEKEGHEVTIEKLLTHTAGIVSRGGAYYSREAVEYEISEVQKKSHELEAKLSLASTQQSKASIEAQVQSSKDRLEVLHKALQEALHVPLSSDEILAGSLGPVFVKDVPKDTYEYSNPGFAILQKVVEEVTHKSFEEAVQERVLGKEKLHARETKFSPPIAKTVRGNDDAGHPLPGLWSAIPYASAGGLWTTAEDFAKVVIGIQRARNGEDSRIIDREKAQLMMPQTPPGTGQEGLGLAVHTTEDGTLYFCHFGNILGCSTVMVGTGNKDNFQGAVILTNSSRGGGDLIQELIRSIAQVYNWPGKDTLPMGQVPDIKPEEVSPAPVPREPWLEKTEGTYTCMETREGKSILHTVTIVRENDKVIAEVDGGKANESRGGSTLELVPVNDRTACYRKEDGQYSVCQFSEPREAEGGKIQYQELELYGAKHVRQGY